MSRGQTLVIEDHPDNLQLLTWLLEDEGFDVTGVESGEEAVKEAENAKYQLIISDITLPGISGLEVAQNIRKNTSNKTPSDTPIIALTGHARTEDAVKMREVGFNNILTKPIDESQLIDLLNQYFPG